MGVGSEVDNDQAELDALNAVVKAMRPLSAESQRRVADSAMVLLGIGSSQGRVEMDLPAAEAQVPLRSAVTIRDIRALKEQRTPESANEMAAVVAYYLTEIANPSEQKKTIGVSDVEKYFKQAQYPLPSNVPMTLVNAKNAGYFDAVGGGQYKLNPVGYNLVAHTLPRSKSSGKIRSGRGPKTNKKRLRKKSSGRK